MYLNFLLRLQFLLLSFSIYSVSAQVTVNINSGNPIFPFPQFLAYTWSGGHNLGNLATTNSSGIPHAEMEQLSRDAWQIMANRFTYTGTTVNGVKYVNPEAGAPYDCAEADGYALLAAVSMCDKTTFDGLWMRCHDIRMITYPRYSDGVTPNAGYLYGKNTLKDNTDAATDGDVDIALALLMAWKQWGDNMGVNASNGTPISYKTEALNVINGIVEITDRFNVPADCRRTTGDVGFDGYLKSGNTWGELTNWANGTCPAGPEYGGATQTYVDYNAPAYFKEFGDFLTTQAQPAWNISQYKRVEASADWIIGKWISQAPGNIPWAGHVDLAGTTVTLSTFNEGEDFRLGMRTILNYIWHGNPTDSWNPTTHQVMVGTPNTYEQDAGKRLANFVSDNRQAPWNQACQAMGGTFGLTYFGPISLLEHYSATGAKLGSFPLNKPMASCANAAVAAQDYDLMGKLFRKSVYTWDGSAGYTTSVPSYMHDYFRLNAMIMLSGNYHPPSKMVASANMKVYMAVDKTFAYNGDLVTYTLSYRNYGSLDATSVIIEDNIPSEYTFVSASDGGTYAGGKATWNIGTVTGFKTATGVAATKGTVTLVCRVKTGANGRVCNEATITCTNGSGWTSNEYPNNQTAVMERNCVDLATRALQITKTATATSVAPGASVGFQLDFTNSSTAGWLNGGRPGVVVSAAYSNSVPAATANQVTLDFRLFHGADEAYIDYGNYRISYFISDTKYTSISTAPGWQVTTSVFEPSTGGPSTFSQENIVAGSNAFGSWNQRLMLRFGAQLATVTPYLTWYNGNTVNIHQGGASPLRAIYRINTSDWQSPTSWTDDWSFDASGADADGNKYYPITDDWTDPNNGGIPVTKWHPESCETATHTINKMLVEEWDGYTWRRVFGNGPVPGRDVDNVIVTDTVPAGFTFSAFTQATTLGITATITGKIIKWTIPKMLIGQTGTIKYTATADACTGGNTIITNKGWIQGNNESPINSNVDVTVSCSGSVCTAPTVTAGTTTATICNGASATITATPASGVTYLWSDANTSASHTVTPAISTTYTVTVTNTGNTCSATATVGITVNDIPTVTTSANTPCEGSQLKLTSVVTPAGGATIQAYNWSGPLIYGGTTQSPVVSNVATLNMAGTYTITVTDSKSCTNTSSVAVTVLPQPVSTITPDKPIICKGQQSAILTASGGTYVWDDASTLTARSVSPIIASTYTVTVTGANLCTNTATVAIGIFNPAPVLVSSKSVCAGNSESLTASGGKSYVWSSGEIVNNITKTPAVTTTYTVTSTDVNGCTNTKDPVITVNAGPTVNAGTDYSSCKDDAAQLTATGSVGATYIWSSDANTTLSTTNIANPTATLNNKNILIDETHTYTVTVSDATSCTSSDNIVITYQAQCKPSVVLTAGKSSICKGTSTTVDITITSAKTLTAISYSDGGPSVTYPVTGVGPVYTVPSIPVTPLATTTYTVSATDNSSSVGTGTVVITVNALPTVTVNSPSVCADKAANLSATATGSSGYSYLWTDLTTNSTLSIASATAGTYSVTVTDINQCSASANGTVSINPAPTVNAENDFFICKDDAASLSAISSTANSYTWAADASCTLSSTTIATPTGSLLNTNISNDAAHTYTVTITDANTCTASDEVIVTYQSQCKPSVVITGDTTLCTGDNTTLTATITSQKTLFAVAYNDGVAAPVSLSFTGSAPTYTVTIPLTPNATTTYTVAATDNDGSIGSAAITVNVHSIPVAAVTDVTVCPNSAGTLSASGAGNSGTYKWNSSETTSFITKTPATPTQYTVTVTTLYGCSDDASASILHHTLPTANAGSTKAICKDNPLAMNPYYDANYTYKWASATDGVVVSPTVYNTDVSYSTPSALSADAKVRFSLTVTDNTTFCFDTSSVVINFEYVCMPHVYIDKTDTVLCKGEDFILKTTNSNVQGTASYVWSDGRSGAGPFTITAPATNQTYAVTITDSYNNKSGSDQVIVVVNELPTAAPVASTTSICIGKSTDLSVTNSYTSGIKSLIWNGGYTMQPYQIIPTTAGVSTYSVTITDNNNCTDSELIAITVNELPTVNLDAGGAVCKGDDTVLVASTNGTIFLWDNGIATASNTVTPIASPSIYSITVTDAIGCSDKAQVTITFNPIPIANLPDNFSLCKGNSTTITVLGNGTTYKWSDNSSTASITNTPLINTTYAVTIYTAEGCSASNQFAVTINELPTAVITGNLTICENDKTTLTVSNSLAPNDIQGLTWNDSNGSISPITVTPTTNSTYTVTITNNNGCSAATSVAVVVNPLPTIVFPAFTDSLCISDSTFLLDKGKPVSPGTGVYSGTGVSGTNFDASVAGSGNHTITYTYTNEYSCVKSDSKTKTVLPKPVSPDAPGEICDGQTTQLNANNSGASFVWNTGEKSQKISVMPDTAGTFIYIVTITSGSCDVVNTVSLTVNPNPTVSFTSSGDNGCQPYGVEFTETTNIACTNFVWNFGDGSTDTTFSNTATHTYLVDGSYSVSVKATSVKGCVGSILIPDKILVQPKPKAVFEFNPTTPTNFDPVVYFTDKSEGTVQNWSWNFGDTKGTNTSDVQNPTHSFSAPGKYTITMSVGSDMACSDTTSLSITVKADHTFYIPNAFTPNDDDKNETFGPSGLGINPENYDFYVYSRWGELIYHSTDYYSPWQGRKNNEGDVLQEGVYSWICVMKDLEGNVYKYKGAVSLLK